MKRDPRVHAAVLSWLVDGALQWHLNDRVIYPAPKQVRTDTEDWRARSDLILVFWRDKLIADRDCHVMATELFDAFNDWLRTNRFAEWAEPTFVERLEQHQETERHKVERSRIRRARDGLRRRPTVQLSDPPERYMAWLGLRWRTKEDDEETEDDKS